MTKRRIASSRLAWAGFTLFLTLPMGSVAQTNTVMERSLEELSRMGLSSPPNNIEVTTAAKFQQSAAEVPMAVHVVTAEDIHTFGYRSLGEILRSLPGLYVTSDHQYTYLGARGFGLPGDYNTRVLILIDGERINEINFDSALVGSEFPLDVDLIERVEYVPGPGSAIYGNNAFFGVVNVITKHGHDIDGVELSAAYSGYATHKGRVSVGKRFDNGFNVLLSATRLEREGPQIRYWRPEGERDERLDYDRATTLFGKLSYGPFTLEGGRLDRDDGLPMRLQDGALAQEQGGKTEDWRRFLTARYEDKIAPDWGLYLRLGYSSYHFLGTYPFLAESALEPGRMERIIGKESNATEWWGGEFRLTNTYFDRHHLTVGAEGKTFFGRWMKFMMWAGKFIFLLLFVSVAVVFICRMSFAGLMH